MDKIARQIDFLRYLVVAVPSQRKQLFRYLSREQINVISEICLNLLHGIIEITDQDFCELNRHKNTFRKLAVKSVDNNTKRELMYKDATGIRTLVSVFLKQFDKDSESDSSASDDYQSPQKPATYDRNADERGEGISQTDTYSSVSISAVDSETTTTTASASTTDNKRPPAIQSAVGDKSPGNRSFLDCFADGVGETAWKSNE